PRGSPVYSRAPLRTFACLCMGTGHGAEFRTLSRVVNLGRTARCVVQALTPSGAPLQQRQALLALTRSTAALYPQALDRTRCVNRTRCVTKCHTHICRCNTSFLAAHSTTYDQNVPPNTWASGMSVTQQGSAATRGNRQESFNSR